MTMAFQKILTQTYINNMSILTDLKLIFATISILFISEKTEGIDSNHILAMDLDDEESYSGNMQKKSAKEEKTRPPPPTGE